LPVGGPRLREVYAILLAPASNRVYAGEAARLVAAELSVLLNGVGRDHRPLESTRLAGVEYLFLDLPRDPIVERELGRASAVLAGYEWVAPPHDAWSVAQIPGDTHVPNDPPELDRSAPEPPIPDETDGPTQDTVSVDVPPPEPQISPSETPGSLNSRLAPDATPPESAGLLRPVALPRPDRFDDDLVTIPKYAGKTNEQFTRLLLNVTLASCRRDSDRPATVLDPMSGRGTTLSTAWILGHHAFGVESDPKAVEAQASFLRTYLRRKRLKHRLTTNPVRRDGKPFGRRLDAEVRPDDGGPELQLTVFTGDTRDSATLYGKRRFDAVVVDAPYGVVHGSARGPSGGNARDRSAAGLLAEAIPVWARQLRPGGALGVSWNTLGLQREGLAEIARGAGLTPLTAGPYLRFGHRVDSSIHRDLFVATVASD
jgi:SAM-dependent methyltransferase